MSKFLDGDYEYEDPSTLFGVQYVEQCRLHLEDLYNEHHRTKGDRPIIDVPKPPSNPSVKVHPSIDRG